MSSVVTPIAADAVDYARGLIAKLYVVRGDKTSLRQAAYDCGVKAKEDSWYRENAYYSNQFTYIVVVNDGNGDLAALLGVTKDDDGDLGMEFESFIEWSSVEEITHFVKTTLTIDIDPALFASAIAVLPRGVGKITIERDLFDKLNSEQWKTLCSSVDDDWGRPTITP